MASMNATKKPKPTPAERKAIEAARLAVIVGNRDRGVSCDCSICDAPTAHDRPGRTFTFYLRYPEFCEEIDVWAGSYEAAEAHAAAIAAEAYDPGFVLAAAPTGGSGGWVTVYR